LVRPMDSKLPPQEHALPAAGKLLHASFATQWGHWGQNNFWR